MIDSPELLTGSLRVMTVGVCLGWGLHEMVLLVRNLPRGRDAQDEIFGSVIGLLIVAIGLIGIFRHHQGW